MSVEPADAPGPPTGRADPWPGPGRRRHRPPERRAQIVKAAGTLLRTSQLGRIGLRDIAAAAGVSVGTVTYHFASVDDILDLAFAEEVTAHYVALERRVRAEVDPLAALRLLAEGTFNVDTAQHWQVWLHILRRHRGGDLGAQRDRYEQWEHTIGDLVTRGVELGVFRCDDVPGAVAVLVAVVDGLSLRHLRQSLDVAEARRLFLSAAYRLLDV